MEREPRSREARSCGTGALTGGAQLASPGWDMKLHRARSHIGAIGETMTLLCLSCWGRSDLSQQFQVLQDNLRREGWCRVSTYRGRWLSELSFPNPHRERMRWEANTKSQHTEKGVSKRGLPTKLLSGNFKCLQRGWGRKDRRGKKPISALRVPREHMKLNQIYTTRNRACLPLVPLRGSMGFASTS